MQCSGKKTISDHLKAVVSVVVLNSYQLIHIIQVQNYNSIS